MGVLKTFCGHMIIPEIFSSSFSFDLWTVKTVFISVFWTVAKCLLPGYSKTSIALLYDLLTTKLKTFLPFYTLLVHSTMCTFYLLKHVCLVRFYGISTIVGYSMPNLVYTYIWDIYMICKHKSTKLNSSKYCCVQNTSIKHQSFVYTQLNYQTVLFQTI